MVRNVKPTMVSIEPWILREIVGISSNRSARIKELLIKGWMYEKQHKGELEITEKGEVKDPVKAFAGILSRDSEDCVVSEWLSAEVLQ